MINSLAELGLTAARIAELRRWSVDGHEVTLRFASREQIKFDREVISQIESPEIVQVTETSDGGGKVDSRTSKVPNIPDLRHAANHAPAFPV